MATIISNSPTETTRLGESWGREAESGWLIGLTGDLGAGKTQLVQGIALGLGVRERVSSPTFGIVNEIDSARLPFCHLDLYRLKGWDDVVNAGIDGYLIERTGVVVVEWIDRCLSSAAEEEWLREGGGRFRRVTIEVLAESRRSIRYEDFGD